MQRSQHICISGSKQEKKIATSVVFPEAQHCSLDYSTGRADWNAARGWQQVERVEKRMSRTMCPDAILSHSSEV